MLLGTLGASLLWNLLSGKRIVRAGSGNKKGKGIVRASSYVLNLDEYAEVGTHWIALFCRRSEIVYFDSFGVEHVPEEIKKFIGNKNIKANIFRVQANDSVMCGYFCIGFIDFMLAGKKLTDFTSMFSPYDFKKNDNIILSYFKDEWN